MPATNPRLHLSYLHKHHTGSSRYKPSPSSPAADTTISNVQLSLLPAINRRCTRPHPIHKGLTPDVVPQPVQILLHHCPLLLRLIDRMSKPVIQHHLHRHTLIFERLPQFKTIWHGNPFIPVTLLNQSRRLRLRNISDRRSLLVNLRIIPRRSLQILPRKRSNVRVHVISHPVRNSSPHRHRLEPATRSRNECRNVPALAPTHRTNAIPIYKSLRDQIIDTGNNIGIIPH